MTPAQLLEHALALPGAWPDNPWGHEHPVVKVHDKIFAFVGGDGVGVKSGPTREVADEWLDLPRGRQRDGLHRPLRVEQPAFQRGHR